MPQMPTTDEVTQEVRLAVVLYGGVSLAIYINGAVQEMLRLVRSTSQSQSDGTAYGELGAILERAVVPVNRPANASKAVKTRFKIDIISGTSAGGINGVFLAKALANNADLTPIQTLWFEEGDIGKLLNTKESYEGIATPPNQTESLLNSRRMYVKLLEAFDSMDNKDRRNPSAGPLQSPLAEEIDLFATTTDIEGVPVPIQLLDNVVYERRYRNAYHFRFITNERNDFEADNNPFLAFAARCTSSFPFAFEPMRLCDIDDALGKNSNYAQKSYCHSKSTRWQKFYTNYLDGTSLGGNTVEPIAFPKRSFGDGGYLNNAPFSYAVEALIKRQSDVPVERKLFYVEPSPKHPELDPQHTGKPNAIQNSLAALITIPGYQTIRNDLMRVLRRNKDVSRINKTVRRVEDGLESATLPLPMAVESQEITFRQEAFYRAYYQMRATEVTDRLAQTIARVREIDEGSAYFAALRSIVRAWRERTFSNGTTVATVRGSNRVEKFLADFDLPYRIRRLRFVLRKLDALYALRLPEDHPAHIDALKVVRFGLQTGQMNREQLSDVRAAVAKEYGNLKDLLHHLLAVPEPPDCDTPPRNGSQPSPAIKLVRDALPERAQMLAVLRAVITGNKLSFEGFSERSDHTAEAFTTQATIRNEGEPKDTEALFDKRAANLVDREIPIQQALDITGRSLSALLEQQHLVVHAAFRKSCENSDAGRIALRYYQSFDDFDAVQYSMAFGTDIGEPDIVDIVRICPEDAAVLVPNVSERRKKLKGLVAASFGAFFDENWRENDLLWGRLDTAERLIASMLPLKESKCLRDRLIDKAHEEILENFKVQTRIGKMALTQLMEADPKKASQSTQAAEVRRILGVIVPGIATDRASHVRLMDIFRMVVPKEVSRASGLIAAAKSTEIVGKILESLSSQQGVKQAGSSLATVGRIVWGLVEISVPRSLGTVLGRYWQTLILLLGVLLILAGLFTGQMPLSGAGWAAVGIAIALLLLRNALHSFMRGGKILRMIRVVTEIACICVFLIGILQVWRAIGSFWGKSREEICHRLNNCPALPGDTGVRPPGRVEN